MKGKRKKSSTKSSAMTIEKVHGLHATSITLNDRFTLLTEAPTPRVMRSKRRSVSQSLSNKSFNLQNRNLIQQIAYHLDQANRQAVKQRLGLRRYGSESSLPGLRRSNSTGNLNQWGIKNRLSWRQSNGNLSRANSFNNLVGMFRGRGFRRRGARMGLTRGRMRGRGGRQMVGRLRQVGAQAQRGQAQHGRAVGGRRARGRGRARGGGGRGAAAGSAVTSAKKPVPTKEELDLQLDQYMASTRWALDKQLDAYMDSAMKFE